ncbi:MAG: glycoside hydrolase domain-containing protein [Alistipes onderdonkii]
MDRKLKAPETGSYLLGLQSDDGARLWLDGELVIDDWGPHGYSMTPTQKNVMLEVGRMYDIRVDYYQHEWNSRVKLSWIRPGDAARKLLLPGNKRLACSTKCGAYVRFEAATGETVRAWVGTSFISEEDARANLEREIAGAGVDKIARATAAKWNEALACIELPGATEQQKQVFYTALYHASLLPRSISENGRYRSPYNGQVCEGESFTDYSTWDSVPGTSSAAGASETRPGVAHGHRTAQWIRRRRLMPKWPNPGYTNCMMGTHSDAIIADAYVKGVRGSDEQKAAEAMLKNANVKGNHIAWGRLGIEDYNSLGYVPGRPLPGIRSPDDGIRLRRLVPGTFLRGERDTEKAREYDLRSQRFKTYSTPRQSWCAPVAVTAHGQRLRLQYQRLERVQRNGSPELPQELHVVRTARCPQALIELMGGNDAMAAFLDDIFDNGIYYVGDEFFDARPRYVANPGAGCRGRRSGAFTTS